MRTRPIFPALHVSAAATLALLFGAAGTLVAASVKVVGGEAGLYAKKSASATVGTVQGGVVLEALSAPEGGWIQVSPPPSMDCWIYSATVENGVTVVGHGKVRTSPNSTAPNVASVPRNTALDIRGKQGDWYRIAPPPGTKLWMRAESVASTTEAPTAPPVAPPPPVVVTPTTQPPPVVVPTTQPAIVVPTTQPPVVVPTTQPPVVVPTTQPPVVVPTTRPPVVVPTTRPPKPAQTPSEFADPNILVPRWEPPKEESVPTPLPTPPKTTTTVPSPVPPPPKTTPTVPAPVATPPVTTTWTVPVPRTTPPAPTPSTRSAASPSATSRPTVSRVQTSYRTHLPQHEVPEEWQQASSGTLLSSKKHRLDLRSTPPATLSQDRLAPRYIQGERGCAIGTLVKTGWSFSTKPGDYEIVTVDAEGHTERVAYVHGSSAMLEPFVQSRVFVEGTCWWLRSVRAATLVPDSAASIQRLP